MSLGLGVAAGREAVEVWDPRHSDQFFENQAGAWKMGWHFCGT